MAVAKKKRENEDVLSEMDQFSDSGLGGLYRKELRKSKDQRDWTEAQFDIAYPTGFLSFDFMNGVQVDVQMKDGSSFNYNSIGIVDGSMITMVGRSGCGKTTFAMQSLGAIIRRFPNAVFLHEDIEGGISSMRKRQLLGMTEEQFQRQYICRNTGISTQNFFSRIIKLHDIKMEHYAEYEYDTGLYDSDGNRIYKLEPSVILLDSWAMLMADEIADEEGLASNMTIVSGTKLNTQIIRRLIPKLKEANIILCVINHILPDPSPTPKKAQVAWLKMGERCPGGETAIYLANNFLRFDDGSKLNPDKDFGIAGINVNIQFVKSRTNNAGLSIPMVLNYDIGFDPELSALVLLKDKDRVVSGTYMYFDNYPDKKFRQKEFKNKLQEDPEFLQIFIQVYKEELDKLINKNAVMVREEIVQHNKVNFTDMMLDDMMSSIPQAMTA